MIDFQLMKATNGGWVVREGIDNGYFRPFRAFSTTADLLKALPEILEVPQPTKIAGETLKD